MCSAEDQIVLAQTTSGFGFFVDRHEQVLLWRVSQVTKCTVYRQIMLTERPGAFQSQALVGVQAKWAKCFGGHLQVRTWEGEG